MRDRVFAAWRRALSLTWPVMTEQTFNTFMRTTDIFITAAFAPAAIAAIGLADLYTRLPLRIGLGLGSGAIALSSQDTGREAKRDRDEAITQALIIGFLAGIPFVLFGLFFSEWAIAVLGADDAVVQLGGTYLLIVFLASPARIVGLIGAQSLQGTGNTRTPMVINIIGSILNIVGSVVLGFGLGPFPELRIVGVALATAGANVLTALAFLVVIGWSDTDASFAHPQTTIITRHLVSVSAPKVGGGMITMVAQFMFNAILVGFGTAVYAGYNLGRRLHQQLTGPIYRSFRTTASIVVGQELGGGDADEARFQGLAVAGLALGILFLAGSALIVWAEPLVRLFTDDPGTVTHSIAFARVYGALALAFGGFNVFSGLLRGGSDTRTPFYARISGVFGFLLGGTYLGGVVLGYGVVAAYVAMALCYIWMAGVVVWAFFYGDWARRTAEMITDREAAKSPND
ncbi:MAG: MATE family efflux transporter [Haloarculaceae archaeon]